jgi:hypothetical protein
MRTARIMLDAFFDGFGPGALFFRAKEPGAPTQVFADETTELDPRIKDAMEFSIIKTSRA